MVEVGRDLCVSSSPTTLLKQGLLQEAAQDLVQAGPEYLQRGTLHNLPGQPVSGLHHPQSEELPHVQVELPSDKQSYLQIIKCKMKWSICLPKTQEF